MIRPVRRLHARLLPVLALAAAVLLLVSMLGRAPEPVMGAWPDALDRSARGGHRP